MRALDDRNDPALAASTPTSPPPIPSVIGIVGNLTGADDAGRALALCQRRLRGHRSDGYGRRRHAAAVSTTSFGCRPTTARRAGSSPAPRLTGKRGVAALAVAFDGDYGYDVARGFVQQAKPITMPPTCCCSRATGPIRRGGANGSRPQARATSSSAARRPSWGRSPRRCDLPATPATSARATDSSTATRSRPTPTARRRVRRVVDAAARSGSQRRRAHHRLPTRGHADHGVLRVTATPPRSS